MKKVFSAGFVGTCFARVLPLLHTALNRSTLLVYASRRWKRALLLLPVLVIPFVVAAVGLGHAGTGNIGLAGIISGLTGPLALFAEQSPGSRGPGALLSTKPDFAPHERILAAMRERAPLPGQNSPVTAEDFASVPTGGDTLPEGQNVGAPAGNGFSANQRGGSLSSTGSSFGNGIIAGGFPISSGSPSGIGVVPQKIADIFNPSLPLIAGPVPEAGGSIPVPVPVASLPPGTTPPDQTFVPLPLDVPAIPSSPATVKIPEPSTWAAMLFGLLVIRTTVRRGLRKQSDLIGAQ